MADKVSAMASKAARRQTAGLWLLRARGQAGLSQRDVAGRLGRTSANVSAWERGINDVPDEISAELASILGQPEHVVRQGLGMYVPRTTVELDDRAIVRLPVDLSDDEVGAVRVAVDAIVAAVRAGRSTATNSSDAQPSTGGSGGPHAAADLTQDRDTYAVAAYGVDPESITAAEQDQMLALARKAREEADSR